jgi:hypothetical protein
MCAPTSLLGVNFQRYLPEVYLSKFKEGSEWAEGLVCFPPCLEMMIFSPSELCYTSFLFVALVRVAGRAGMKYRDLCPNRLGDLCFLKNLPFSFFFWPSRSQWKTVEKSRSSSHIQKQQHVFFLRWEIYCFTHTHSRGWDSSRSANGNKARRGGGGATIRCRDCSTS